MFPNLMNSNHKKYPAADSRKQIKTLSKWLFGGAPGYEPNLTSSLANKAATAKVSLTCVQSFVNKCKYTTLETWITLHHNNTPVKY
jgi:hypothetical protein